MVATNWFLYPDKCLVCNFGIDPQVVEGSCNVDHNVYGEQVQCQIVFKCRMRNFQSYFVVYYDGFIMELGLPYKLEPQTFYGKNFGADVLRLKEELPTAFFEIYKEAEQAEQMGLKLICGGGYRKALEFLVKNFAKYIHEDDKTAIANIEDRKFPLSACIKLYMTDYVKVFSTLISRLGNDEMHYTKEYNKDLDFMKKHIDALLVRISSYVLEKEAEMVVSRSR